MSKYWGDKEEQIFRDYYNCYNENDKSIIVSKRIIPALMMLISKSILSYLPTRNSWIDLNDLKSDCLIYLIDKTLPHYSPDRGTAFAYFTFSLKNCSRNRYAFQNKRYAPHEDSVHGEVVNLGDYVPCDDRNGQEMLAEYITDDVTENALMRVVGRCCEILKNGKLGHCDRQLFYEMSKQMEPKLLGNMKFSYLMKLIEQIKRKYKERKKQKKD